MDARLRLRAAAALVAAALLSACGGGIWIGIDDFDDQPPAVELAAASTSAPAGSVVRLVAAATDDSGVDRVHFYRYDGNTAVRLGSDSSAPYEWQLLVPSDGRASVTVFARAVDEWDNAADSALVTITITP